MKQITNTERKVYDFTHPFFVIDVDPSRIDRISLCQTLASLRDTYFTEYVGTVMEGGKPVTIDRMFVWYYTPDFSYSDETYQPGALVCFLQKLGFDISEQDVYLYYDNDCYGGIGCELAPIVAFPEGFLLDYMSGNVSIPEYYIELMSTYSHNHLAMCGYDRHIRGVHNQIAGKEESGYGR